MTELKLKKISWLRRRFIRSGELRSLVDWSDIYEELKEEILSTSSYQLVGHKGIVEIDSLTGKGVVLIEVVGVPRAGLHSQDIEPCKVLVYDYPKSGFDVDFSTLMREAKAIISGISERLDTTYHIVFEGPHLALHFFI